MTRVRLVHDGIRFRCTGEPDCQFGAGHGLRARLGRGLGDKEVTCMPGRSSTDSERVIGPPTNGHLSVDGLILS